MVNHKFPPNSYHYETDESLPVEQRGEADEAETEAEDFHSPSLAHEGRETLPENEFALPRESSPGKFYVKLRRRLSNIGVRYEKLTRKTLDGQAPACFNFAGADYDAWLTAASLTSDVPHRYDMPGEPNYCRDCTPEFRGRAIAAGKCQFSNVLFETVRSNGEKETVGVSRSPHVVPVGYRVYREMVVDEEALSEEAIASINAKRGSGRPRNINLGGKT